MLLRKFCAERKMKTLDFVIEISGLGFSYSSKNGAPPLRVLHNLCLEVREGEFFSIIGPSGCGKSTFLKLIGGLLNPDEGRININGKTPDQARREREFGFVFQNPVLLEWRTVLENIQLPGEIFSDKSITNKAHELIELVGLTGFKDALPLELSGGMQSRVAIARALVYHPKILLMDESFGDLDELTRDRMNLELMRIWERTGRTILFVTHSIPEAIFLGDRVAIMSPRPSRVQEVIEIGISRPRSIEVKENEKFVNLTRILREKLRIEF